MQKTWAKTRAVDAKRRPQNVLMTGALSLHSLPSRKRYVDTSTEIKSIGLLAPRIDNFTEHSMRCQFSLNRFAYFQNNDFDTSERISLRNNKSKLKPTKN